MGIFNDDMALNPARFGAARFGAARFGYIPDNIRVSGTQPLVEYRPAPEDDQNVNTTWTEQDLTP